MSPRGVTHRIPATCLPEEREVCPRCRVGVVRLGRLVVCGELSCDWSRPRFEQVRREVRQLEPAPARPISPKIAARAVEAAAQRQRDEQALLAALRKGPATILELARLTGISHERCRQQLVAMLGRVSRRRLGQSTTWVYDLTEEAIAC